MRLVRVATLSPMVLRSTSKSSHYEKKLDGTPWIQEQQQEQHLNMKMKEIRLWLLPLPTDFTLPSPLTL